MKIFHRILAVLLCVSMLCAALPVSAGQGDWDVTLQFLHGQGRQRILLIHAFAAEL